MKKIILTGGHGCGKSTILLGLEGRGEVIVREAASDYQRIQRVRGYPFPTDTDDFEEAVLKLHLFRENLLEKTTYPRVFLDRGAPDHLVYSDLCNWPLSPELKKAAMEKIYHRVFLVQPFGSDWRGMVTRAERRLSLKLAQRLFEIYSALQVPVFKVPPGPLEKRIDFVIGHS